MLMERPIPLYVGSGSPLSNVGTLTNQGIELEVGYKLSVDKVNLSFLANASYVKNEIKNLGNQTGYIDKESLPTLGTVSRNQNGYPIGYFFGYKAIGVFQTQEEIDNYISPATGKPIQPNAVPGDTKFEDLNGDGVISDDNEDRTMIGKPNPDWMVGLTVAADWNGFDLSAFSKVLSGRMFSMRYAVMSWRRSIIRRMLWKDGQDRAPPIRCQGLSWVIRLRTSVRLLCWFTMLLSCAYVIYR